MLKVSSKFNNRKRYNLSSNQPGNHLSDQLSDHEDDHEEYQYLNLLHDILEQGVMEKGRNGNTLSIFGSSMYFSLENGKIPILTTKKTAWKTCLKELLWFIRGDTNNEHLQRDGVHIWDGNGSREFLDSRGLDKNRVGDLGPIYGHQWRYFNADYQTCDADYSGQGVDQLQEIIDTLKNPETRTSRRMVMTAWNPCKLNEMALPPCHILCQFHVTDGSKLSCSMYQRSNDECCGTPFNIASYSFLTHLLANHCGLEAYEFIYFKGNCHIYEEHIEGAKLQLQRDPYPFPTISMKQIRDNINDYKVEDFEINNYQHHPPIKFQMVA
jgi:thymidylate synthase